MTGNLCRQYNVAFVCSFQYVTQAEWNTIRSHFGVDVEILVTRIADDEGCVTFVCEPGTTQVDHYTNHFFSLFEILIYLRACLKNKNLRAKFNRVIIIKYLLFA